MADNSLRASGIYTICNTVNGKQYVGSAVNIERRLHEHRTRLRAGSHHSAKLQRAWLKYGEDSFAFGLIEMVTDKDRLIEREQFWIDSQDAVTGGYNVCPRAGSILGVKRSSETLLKMSAWQIGRIVPPMNQATKDKISKANRGIVKTAQWREKLSAAHTGKTVSEETRQLLSIANTGKTHTAETKAKISAAGKGRVKSEQTRLNIANAHRGKKTGPLSQEHREKIGAAHKGRVQSVEWIAKRVATRRRNLLDKLQS